MFPLVLLCWGLTTSVLEGRGAIDYISMFVQNKKNMQPRLLVYVTKQTLGGHLGASGERNEAVRAGQGGTFSGCILSPF